MSVPRGVRRLAAAATVTMLMTLSACGGGDAPSGSTGDLPEVSDPTPTGADVEAEVTDRWNEYWKVRVALENAGTFDKAAFAKVARDEVVESQVRRLQSYQKNKLVRVGEPTFRDAEVRLNEPSAVVLACFNADDWTAKVDGKPWSAKKYGWELTGSVLKQIDGAWYVVDEMSTKEVADMGKAC